MANNLGRLSLSTSSALFSLASSTYQTSLQALVSPLLAGLAEVVFSMLGQEYR
jgi:hypothetical protein